MSELKAETIVPQGTAITLKMYPKAETDAAIAELKQKIHDAEIELRVKSEDCVLYQEQIQRMKQALHDAEMVKDDAEAANTEYRADIEKLKAEITTLKKEVSRQKRLRCYNLKMWCSAERFTRRSEAIPEERHWWERHFYSVCKIWEKLGGRMTHAEFARRVLEEWDLKPGQMCQSCYCQWYHYTIPSGEPFPENRIIGEYTLRKGKVVFILTKRDGTEQVWEAK